MYKKLIFLCVILTTIISCDKPNTQYETITTDFYITNTYTAKYSKVIGYVKYKDLILYADNGNSGYYYKKYNLSAGDTVKVTLDVYKTWEGRGLVLTTSDIDLSEYELK